MGMSFPTISSVGPNAAITHYRPKKGSDLQITTDKIYLCDSGAHFKYINLNYHIVTINLFFKLSIIKQMSNVL